MLVNSLICLPSYQMIKIHPRNNHNDIFSENSHNHYCDDINYEVISLNTFLSINPQEMYFHLLEN